MKVIKKMEKIPKLPKPCGVTLGSFDGVHLGHMYLIDELRKLIDGGSLAVFTFSNHPSHILKNREPTPLLCTPEHKIALLKKAGVDLIILHEFNEEFSKIPYEVFLKDLKKNYPFSHFLVGKGASFGKDKQGDEAHILEISKKLKFKPIYLKKYTFNKQSVSSGFIRHLIDGGDFTFAAKLLGRPFSVYQAVQEHPLSPEVYSLSMKGLCTPPEGSYIITAVINEKKYEGIASLEKSTHRLNFKIENMNQSLIGTSVEIVFEKNLNHELIFQI